MAAGPLRGAPVGRFSTLWGEGVLKEGTEGRRAEGRKRGDASKNSYVGGSFRRTKRLNGLCGTRGNSIHRQFSIIVRVVWGVVKSTSLYGKTGRRKTTNF